VTAGLPRARRPVLAPHETRDAASVVPVSAVTSKVSRSTAALSTVLQLEHRRRADDEPARRTTPSALARDSSARAPARLDLRADRARSARSRLAQRSSTGTRCRRANAAARCARLEWRPSPQVIRAAMRRPRGSAARDGPRVERAHRLEDRRRSRRRGIVEDDLRPDSSTGPGLFEDRRLKRPAGPAMMQRIEAGSTRRPVRHDPRPGRAGRCAPVSVYDAGSGSQAERPTGLRGPGARRPRARRRSRRRSAGG